MPVASKRKSPLSIENLRFRQGSVRGKLVSEDGSPIPRAVSIRLDGQEMGVLRVRGRDPLEGPFTWFVPARHYDGGDHRFEVAVAMDGQAPVVVDGFDRRMDIDAAPRLIAGAAVNAQGQIEGFAWNSVQPNEPLAIEVWERGVLSRTIRAEQATPPGASADTPAACGFAFVPQDLAGWIKGHARLVAPKFGETVDVRFEPVLDSVAVDQVFVDEDLAVTVARPAVLAACEISVEIDGLERRFAQRDLADTVQIAVERPLADDREDHRLDVAFSFEGERVAVASTTFRWQPPSGLLVNPDLRDWQGDGLIGWEVADGHVASPAMPGDGVAAPFAPVQIAPRERRAAAGGLRLSQPLALDEATIVDLEVVARFDGAIDVQLIDDQGMLAGVVLDGEPQWTRHRRTLELERAPASGLQVVLLGAETEVVELAYLNVGPQGFQRDIVDADAFAGKGLSNGDFQRWSRGLTFQTTAKAMETADGWLLSSAKGLKGVRASLVQLEAGEGDVAYGLGLKGDTIPSTLMLANAVNPSIVQQGGEWTLDLTVQRHPGSARGVARLGRILLSDTPTGEGAVAVIGRGVLLGLEPRRAQLRIKADDWRAAGVDFRRAAGEQPQVFVVIEFQERTLDAVVTGVALTKDAPPEAQRDAFVSFEDFNLISQLDRTVGLESWRRETITPGAVLDGAEAGTAAPVARWSKWNYPAVDIVVPVYNAEVHTLGCLSALVEATDIPYRLIVVDDGSAPATGRALDAFAADRPWVEVIHNPENLGYTRASNIGLKAGRAPWVVLLNSDTVVTPGWLAGLLDIGVSDVAIGMVGPLSNAATWQSVPAVRDAHGQWAVNRIPEDLSLEDWSAAIRRSSRRAHPQAPLLNGFCTLIRRTALQAVDFLDEETFPVGYGEEVDLCIRVAKAGYRMHIADDVFVYHHKSSSFGKERRAVLSKAGGAAVRQKHRDVNLANLEEQLATLVPLLQLRQDLKAATVGAAQ